MERPAPVDATVGSWGAFSDSYRSTMPIVYRYLYRGTAGDVQLAEDLTQATFETAMRAFSQGHREALEPAWLHTVARSRLIDHYRRARREKAKLTLIAGRPAWPWQSEMIAILLHKGNVYTELHGVSPKRFTDEFKREIRTRLKHKVMFGLDFPMLRYEKIKGDWIAEGYPEDVLENVFHRNAQRLMEKLGRKVDA